MINPPYAQRDEESRELVFVRTLLDCLVKGGTGVAIVPMSCVIGSSPHKEELLRHHTLEAVMSMPDELFYPVGVVTCVMVLTAKVPHAVSNRKTWFGYWKNDGFIKTKHRGRVDPEGGWHETRRRWVEAFRNRDDVPGLSIKAQVSASDEWCAEAFMETDYRLVDRACFERAVRDYILHGAVTGADDEEPTEEAL
jgi:type I restriction-modification system DNA methylase subunit